ncbi:MAG: Stk1 family PASTA domain-containing Ser/Thr kinase [Clostridiaceae bacterium]|nr:Stk1 family PASTA domain-containing Ser/Thr kinase [Clostridiaceae bacterium]
MDKLIGTMLDNRYEVLEVIGTGGMAIVYKAKCHRLNRYVAVKVMKEEYAEDEEFKRRFFEESQAVAMLSHPNIVSVYDVSRSGNIEYIVMELIDGITLKDYLSKRGALSWKETTFFAVQIAKALEHAHSRDIIHRDIKPQNIMLLRDGTVKVADFGIAHHSTDQRTYVKGEAIGSVHYVSPEQARGSHIDNRSDIYSLGVVMYEMLTGRLPFEGNTPIEVAVQHINSIPLSPSDYVSDIPQALEAITMKAMNPSPSRRYASATEMIADLEKFKNDPTVIIEVENPIVFGALNDVDATKKISNPGELTVAAPSEIYKRVDEHDDVEYHVRHGKGKKGVSLMNSSMMFAFVSILIFVVGAVYFVMKVINPFGAGDEKLQVPSLEGLEYDVVLKDKNNEYSQFEISVSEEVYDETVAKGFIISQSPKSGKTISDGGEISVVVSLGPKTVTVDDYVGMDGRSVLVILERLGLVATPQYDFSKDVAAGLVIATSPVKDTVLNSGDSILVRISKGPETLMTVVPSLIGMTSEQAAEAIKTAKLATGTITPIESDKTPGQVIFQSLPANSSVEEGSSIDIQISKAPEVKDPDPVKNVVIQYVVEIDAIEGDIQVMVAVDSKVSYTGNHKASEGTVVVELTAAEGDHSVTVFQNGRLTKEENVTFS